MYAAAIALPVHGARRDERLTRGGVVGPTLSEAPMPAVSLRALPLPAVPIAAELEAPWGIESYAAPAVDLSVDEPELLARIRGGEVEADLCEATLANSARMRGALDVAIAEGLHALRKGDRLAQLGYHLDDYGREVLDLQRSATGNLARLGAELQDRPLLREALRSGRVALRAAETVLPVAKGEAEAAWVERAARSTVRELEEAVRRVEAGGDADEEWFRIVTYMPDDRRAVIDAALDVARRVDAGPNRWDQLEAVAQEYLAEFGAEASGDDARALRRVCLPVRPGEKARRAVLEDETGRWAMLPRPMEVPAPEVVFDESMSAAEVDVRLRKLAVQRDKWDEIIGCCARTVRRAALHTMLGFTSFRHYLEERLQLPARAVEQRVKLEEQVMKSPALREARRQGVSYEKLRILAELSEQEIEQWTRRALALTCIDLRRRVEGERARQMRGAKKFTLSMPKRVAEVFAAAVEAVRRRAGHVVHLCDCLTIVGGHFFATWSESVQPPKTRSQKVRERDGRMCQVPGCSHPAADAHHIEFRSHGGSDDMSNLVSVCEFHHQRCIHGGYLRVTGEAPHKLSWWLGGKRWNGGAPVLAVCE